MPSGGQIRFLVVMVLFLGACTPLQMQPTSSATIKVPTATNTVTAKPTSTLTLKPSPTPSPTETAFPTSTATETPTVTPTVTATMEPTFVVLRGTVNQEHVNCYYGPSKAYLYKYRLLLGNRLDIIGYMPDTGYIEVQAIGGNNPCWMNLEFMDVQGDIHQVQPVDPMEVKLPWSPYYAGLSFAKAERNGNEVTVSWSPLVLKAGDSSEQEAYLLEAWVCRDGRQTFVPVGAYENTVRVIDEPGCNEPSFGRVYGVEKHGYTKYLSFDWPQAEETQAD